MDPLVPLNLEGLYTNIGVEQLLANVERARADPAERMGVVPEHGGTALICAGGPSLAEDLIWIRALEYQAATVFAVNGTAAYLSEREIVIHYHVLLDGRASNARFLIHGSGIQCLLASQCDVAVFDRARQLGHSVQIYHADMPGVRERVRKGERLIGGGTTVGLKAVALAYALGYRKFHLFGFDSSYAEDGADHAYPQAENENQRVTEVTTGEGKTYRTSPWMAQQVEDFRRVAAWYAEHGCELHVHGQGLLPDVARLMQVKPQRALSAVYDLWVSPPTYDFLSFLAEAERARRESAFDVIDVVFQPGPRYGFRDDDLPPDLDQRIGMLHRICVSACRLLPSVRNVTVLRERQAVGGEIFPAGWRLDQPTPHYGVQYQKGALQCLRASNAARLVVRKYYPKPYITVTLRECSYWPERNSNKREWASVSAWLYAQKIETVFVHDTEATTSIFSWDIDMRLALYEGAMVNLGTVNGPMALCQMSAARYLMLNPVTEGCRSSSTEFLAANGIHPGDQFGENGTIVWGPDRAEVIIEALKQFFQSAAVLQAA
jgi:hypothetical protein